MAVVHACRRRRRRSGPTTNKKNSTSGEIKKPFIIIISYMSFASLRRDTPTHSLASQPGRLPAARGRQYPLRCPSYSPRVTAGLGVLSRARREVACGLLPCGKSLSSSSAGGLATSAGAAALRPSNGTLRSSCEAQESGTPGPGTFPQLRRRGKLRTDKADSAPPDFGCAAACAFILP